MNAGLPWPVNARLASASRLSVASSFNRARGEQK
jgi:hypothetical protein